MTEPVIYCIRRSRSVWRAKDPDSHCAARRHWSTVSHLIVTELLIIPIRCDSSLVVTKQHIFCLRVKQKRQQAFFFSLSVARPRGVVLKLMWATWHLSQHSNKQKIVHLGGTMPSLLNATSSWLFNCLIALFMSHTHMHTKPIYIYIQARACMPTQCSTWKKRVWLTFSSPLCSRG